MGTRICTTASNHSSRNHSLFRRNLSPTSTYYNWHQRGCVRTNIWESWARFPTLCASLPALDPLAASAPPAFTYAGPIQEQLPTSGWRVPWTGDDPRPMVLVSFSAARVWDQTSRLQRTLYGLSERPVKTLVTASTADTMQLTIPANACIVPFIPHEEVLPQTAVMVTHAGHGTATAALAHGVPLVCLAEHYFRPASTRCPGSFSGNGHRTRWRHRVSRGHWGCRHANYG